MKKKICMIGLVVVNFIMMFFPWFRGIETQNDVYGTMILNNPIALSCLLLCILGILIRNEYSKVIETIGWIGFISMLIYEFLTWHIRINGGMISLKYSMSITYSHFYYALIIAILSYIIYRIFTHKIDKYKLCI